MKVYGFDSTDIVRGELRAAEADSLDLEHSEMLRNSLDWEYISTRFPEARAALIKSMKDEGSDPEMIQGVRRLKASYISVD